MAHCAGGNGAYNFGGPGQDALSNGGSGQSSTFDEEHDMILATIDWVENGKAPKEIIASSYVEANKSQGVAFQRKLCPVSIARSQCLSIEAS